MVAVYVLLGLEIVHRTVLATFASVFSIILAITFGSISAEESLDFIIGSIDFNTIGLLLGMMIIVAILGETGTFSQVWHKDGQG